MNEGDVFNRNLIIKDIQTLTDMFADKGYAFVNINPVTSEFLNSVSINFKISLNKKVYINRITISGNTRTQDEVLRREIGISEGELGTDGSRYKNDAIEIPTITRSLKVIDGNDVQQASSELAKLLREEAKII